MLAKNRFTLNKQPSDILQEIASNLKELRKQRKISQAQLAAQSGVSLGSLKRFEGSGKIAFDSLLKLAHVLGKLSDFEQIFVSENHEDLNRLFSDKTSKS